MTGEEECADPECWGMAWGSAESSLSRRKAAMIVSAGPCWLCPNGRLREAFARIGRWMGFGSGFSEPE